MTHDERLAVAREVAEKILAKYGDRVTAIAVYGSVAKGEDKEHSDVDMWVATSDSVEDERFFVYKGLPISVAWTTEEARLHAARTVTPFWPLDADENRSCIVLYERGNFMQRLAEAVESLREDDFLRSMTVLMSRTNETWNKMRNAWESGDQYRLLVEARWLALESAMMLGLASRRYYKGGRGLYQMSKEMPKQPKDYAILLDVAGGFTTSDGKEVYKAAGTLWANLCEFVKAEGVGWDRDELPF